MILVSSCSCLCPIHWSQVSNRERRCSWSSADRRCSNYIWVINNFIAYWAVLEVWWYYLWIVQNPFKNYGLNGSRCPLSPKRLLNFNHSFTYFQELCRWFILCWGFAMLGFAHVIQSCDTEATWFPQCRWSTLELISPVPVKHPWTHWRWGNRSYFWVSARKT